MRCKVRFNLGRGKNFLKWKVSYPNGKVVYLNPKEVSLYMEDCKLINQQTTAKKIFNGANKTVCAWIECGSVSINSKINTLPPSTLLHYNPRITPHWIMNDMIVDKMRFDSLFTFNDRVHTIRQQQHLSQ